LLKQKRFVENKKAAKQGGAVAGNARKELEMKTGEKVVSKKKFLPLSKQNKNLK
jgi:DNA-damage-inducible protein D